MLDPITLPARIVDPLHFVFCPDTWAAELKPYAKAKWTHNPASKQGERDFCATAHDYSLKEGDFLAFPQFHMTNGGFYAAHIYAVAKEMACKQVYATLTVEGLTLESVEGEVKTRVTIKPRGIQPNDRPHSVILQ